MENGGDPEFWSERVHRGGGVGGGGGLYIILL